MEQENTSQSKPILETLRNQLDSGVKLSSKSNLTSTHFFFWVASVRQQLIKIFGKDHPQLSLFSLPPKNISKEVVLKRFNIAIEQLGRLTDRLENLIFQSKSPIYGTMIFIGHGRSPIWRELKDFIADRLKLPWDEFNREPPAGFMTFERLEKILSQAAFAFLVFTAEDIHKDETIHARENVIHEAGLFQGRLGRQRAVVLLEEGCTEFSNIHGLSQIRFPRGLISAIFEEIRRVLEREGLL